MIFKDPYYLKGEEKSQTLKLLTEVVHSFRDIENPDQIDKEDYYYACSLLEAEASRRCRQAQSAELYYGEEKRKMVSQALEDYKINAKLEFYAKYESSIQSKTFTPEMMKDLDKLEKRERASCYLVSGLIITERDCNVCPHHACNRTKE